MSWFQVVKVSHGGDIEVTFDQIFGIKGEFNRKFIIKKKAND